MKRAVLAAAAKRDLRDIKTYYVEQGGPELALGIAVRLRSAIRALASTPGLGHKREDLTKLPFLFYPVFDYLIVYEKSGKSIEVTRILHGNRDLKKLL